MPGRTTDGERRAPLRAPLRIASPRFRLWGLGLIAASSVALLGSVPGGFVDFPQMWSAGRTVGTTSLLDPASHQAWQSANGVLTGFFAYPPGAAWLFLPFGFLPMALGFWLHAVVMIGLVAVAGWLGARIYGLDPRVGLVAAFAWAPCMESVAVGQNAPLALALCLLAIDALRRDDDALAGLAVGLLLYKPTIATPLLGLLLLRRRWRALGVASVVAVVWYPLGVAATAGDWSWPAHWIDGLRGYYATDTAGNVAKSLSIPGLLQGHGVAAIVALGAAAVVVLAAIPRLLRSPIVEAGAAACLVGLAVSPHSLNYEAVLVLPALLWAAGGTGTGLSEPARTRLIVCSYLLAPLYLLSPVIGFSSLAVITLAGTAIWISGWNRIGVRSTAELLPSGS